MPITHEPITRPEQLEILKNNESSAPILSIDNLSYAYPDGHQALQGISLQIYAGEKVALVGPNGAGKSTLMLHLNGILNGNGKLVVNKLQVTKENLPYIRAKVGLVFQNPDDQLFSPTVFEDVAFGPLHMGFSEDEVYRRVHLALEQVGMETYGKRLSHHLSAGEKKRVAIATVLSMQPDILVLDEPTSGLDPRARRNLIKLLDSFPLTMLVSTHDLLMVRELFPRTIVMDHGSIVADGPSHLILNDTALLEKHGLEWP
jgi:cobalt/nickel transport system ATP-binding protein